MLRTNRTGLQRPIEGTVRRFIVIGYAIGITVIGFTSEGLLIAPIVFCANYFGFQNGLYVFTACWLVLGLIELCMIEAFMPGTKAKPFSEELGSGPVRNRIVKLSRYWRPMGALAVAWFFGPILSPPFFRALSYRGRALWLWVVVSAPIFCPFWFAVYGGGFGLLRSLV